MAVISLDVLDTDCCANTQRARAANALIRCTAESAPSRLPRTAFPSRHTGSPLSTGKAAVAQAVNAAAKATGSIRPNTSLKVACEGMPLGSSRKLRHQVSFSSATSAIPTQSSFSAQDRADRQRTGGDREVSPTSLISKGAIPLMTRLAGRLPRPT